ncbi:hypothetical protein [Pedobacter sp. Leaf170]|uniref:hypothetical protein n=1 Tax=Pedobacter sp. Leaf170 TaxID=2876558 RepID=UPI001E2EDE71|nr:hypothetical protein [Pedobacter sp. Leaf170]
MSVTTAGAINILFEYLKNSEVLSDEKKVNGHLYKMQRPLNSSKEDVVINAITMGRESVQNGILNVNAYCKNQTLTLPGALSDNSQPDYTRLDEISNLLNKALGEGREIYLNNGSYCFKVQQDVIIPDENEQHYVNFRIEFYSPQ